MGAITIALIVILVAVVLGFAVFLVLYNYRQRQSRNPNASILPLPLFNKPTRFAALDVDEAWDSHVDEEMGYDAVQLKHSAAGQQLSRDELDERYESVMDPQSSSSNPFGSGSSRIETR